MSAASAAIGVRSLAPVLIVDAVEPCLDFWTGALGFTTENQVPGDDGRLVFASVKKGSVEIMYQTRASVVADSPAQASELTGHSVALFITVATRDDLDAIESAVAGAPVVKPRHETFYGSEEIYVREPGGTVVGFAAFT
ncbi:MAG TPA: VOC family protein [Gemmatimonadaceae bacterium]|nr:VOC family protein [Gemmatimonadaceae bacterium]